MEWSKLLPLLILCQPACQVQPPPTTPAAPPIERAHVNDPKSRAIALLAQIPRGEPVLGALSAPLRQHFDELLASLSEPELALVRSAEGEMARKRPLLHLMAGGRSRQAILALATTPAAAEELTANLADNAQLGQVLETTNEVIVRAAREWVRYAQEELQHEDAIDVSWCDALDRVAATLNNIQLRYAARRLWLTLEDSPAARLNLARAAMWIGDVGEARKQYDAVRQAALKDPTTALYAEQIEQLIELQRLTGTPVRGVDEAVAQAGAYLALHDHPSALRVLEPHAERADRHLGVATVRILATHPDIPCSGVTAGLGNPRLCAFSMREDLFESASFDAMARAWQSGVGRTVRSVQDYLGLEIVLPWRARVLGEGTQLEAGPALELSQLCEQVSTLSPDFRSLGLFSRALGLAFGAAARAEPGTSPRIGEADRTRLLREAEKLGQELPNGGSRDTAILGVLALLSQEQDVRPLYGVLGADLPLDHRITRVLLGAWLAAAWNDSTLFERVKAEAVETLGHTPDGALLSSELVLLLAEAANAIEPSADNQETLRQIAEGLNQPSVVDDLRWRALLHLVRAADRRGQSAEARSLLEKAIGSGPMASRPPANAFELLARARLALTGLEADGPEKTRAALAQVFEGRNAPPSVVTWHRLWDNELTYRIEAAKCGRRQPCLKAAAAARRGHREAIAGALPSVAGQLMQRDVLTLGELEMTLDYRPATGVRAVVRTTPALVFLPWPEQA